MYFASGITLGLFCWQPKGRYHRIDNAIHLLLISTRGFYVYARAHVYICYMYCIICESPRVFAQITCCACTFVDIKQTLVLSIENFYLFIFVLLIQKTKTFLSSKNMENKELYYYCIKKKKLSNMYIRWMIYFHFLSIIQFFFLFYIHFLVLFTSKILISEESRGLRLTGL